MTKQQKQIKANLSLDEQSELIVKVFQVSLDTLVTSGLEEKDVLCQIMIVPKETKEIPTLAIMLSLRGILFLPLFVFFS